MSKLSDLFSDAAKNCSELAADLSAIAVELGANPIPGPTPTPPNPTPVPPMPNPAPPSGSWTPLTPGPSPLRYTAAVAQFSFIAAHNPVNGTSLATACWDFHSFPGNDVRVEIYEDPSKPPIFSDSASNSNSQWEGVTGPVCKPGVQYYLVITRAQAGGVYVQQVNS